MQISEEEHKIIRYLLKEVLKTICVSRSSKIEYRLQGMLCYIKKPALDTGFYLIGILLYMNLKH